METLTVTTAQTPKMICNTVKLVPIRRHLSPRIIRPIPLLRRPSLIDVWREEWRHVVGQVEILHGEINHRLELVGERAFEREPFEVDEKHRW